MDQQRVLNKTLGLEIIGSDIITTADIVIPSIPSIPNLKVSIKYLNTCPVAYNFFDKYNILSKTLIYLSLFVF